MNLIYQGRISEMSYRLKFTTHCDLHKDFFRVYVKDCEVLIFWHTSFSSEQNTTLRRDFIQIQNYPIDLQGTALRQAPVDDVYVIACRLRTRSQAPNDVGNDTKFPHAEP